MESVEEQIVESDEQLVRAVMGGRREAFAELIRRHERRVHAVAWVVLRDHHAAQDVTQETFLKAYEGLGRLKRAEEFSGWVAVIARRTAMDQWHRTKRVWLAAEVPEEGAEDGPVGGAAEVVGAVSRLPEWEQRVVWLRFFEGMGVAEIAERLQRPVGTVTKQLSRGLARLRTTMKEKP